MGGSSPLFPSSYHARSVGVRYTPHQTWVFTYFTSLGKCVKCGEGAVNIGLLEDQALLATFEWQPLTSNRGNIGTFFEMIS